MYVTAIPIIIGDLGTVTKGLVQRRRTWKQQKGWRPSKLLF